MITNDKIGVSSSIRQQKITATNFLITQNCNKSFGARFCVVFPEGDISDFKDGCMLSIHLFTITGLKHFKYWWQCSSNAGLVNYREHKRNQLSVGYFIFLCGWKITFTSLLVRMLFKSLLIIMSAVLFFPRNAFLVINYWFKHFTKLTPILVLHAFHTL